MNVFDRMQGDGATEVVEIMHQTDAADGGNSVRLIGLFENKSNAMTFSQEAHNGYSGTLVVRQRKSGWDGRCVTCGHSYVDTETEVGCHGDCTCLSCNVQRQCEEKNALAAYRREWGEE